MMKMQIGIDEERVRKDGLYDLADMWRLIGKTFLEYGCTAERQGDGSMLYSGTATNDYYTAINLAVYFLEIQPWFAQYCTKWIWYDNDDNEELSFQEINLLVRRQQDNLLFKKAAQQWNA